MNREIERLENAIRHINSSLDVDEWAKTEAVAAMRYRIGMLTSRKNEQPGRWVKASGMMPPEFNGCYKCSECGFIAMRDWHRPRNGVVFTDYCPGCGKRMQGPEGQKWRLNDDNKDSDKDSDVVDTSPVSQVWPNNILHQRN